MNYIALTRIIKLLVVGEWFTVTRFWFFSIHEKQAYLRNALAAPCRERYYVVSEW